MMEQVYYNHAYKTLTKFNNMPIYNVNMSCFVLRISRRFLKYAFVIWFNCASDILFQSSEALLTYTNKKSKLYWQYHL